MSSMLRCALPVAILGFVSLGCAERVAAPPIAAEPLVGAHPALEMPRPSPDMAAADLADTLALIEAARVVLTSREFRDNAQSLARTLQELWLTPVGDLMPTDQAVAAFLRIDERYGPVPAVIEWADREATGNRPNVPGEARIRLRPVKLAQWRSNNPVTRSCAINTLVHEMTHTVTRARPRYQMLFKDRGRGEHADRPLVSYTLGALAQCTYLAHRAENIAACVDAWGTNIFKSSCCKETARCKQAQ